MQRQRAETDLKSGQVSAEDAEARDQSLQSHETILMNRGLDPQETVLVSTGRRMMTLRIETGEEDRRTGHVTEALRADQKVGGVLKDLEGHRNALVVRQTDLDTHRRGRGNHQSPGFSALEMTAVKEKGVQDLILTKVPTSKEDFKSLVTTLKVKIDI